MSTDLFDNGFNFISIGRIRPEIVDFIIEKCPDFSNILYSDTDILFWKDRIKHTERHRKDFVSDEEYELCFEQIPDIIRNPEFVSIHPNKDSISFICRFTDHVSVAVRLSTNGRLAYRTMYPLRESQLYNYIKQGRAWKV
ncbi:PBECR3 domain-containing polyvalent protein [Mediterraneibacter agrestimuris]|uniref:PBECR3 domain-containing polyvalent protein n=1 Tax=Mediterraneibacter agrestimuris TaxID=2941333 RepID=UPI0038CBF419